MITTPTAMTEQKETVRVEMSEQTGGSLRTGHAHADIARCSIFASLLWRFGEPGLDGKDQRCPRNKCNEDRYSNIEPSYQRSLPTDHSAEASNVKRAGRPLSAAVKTHLFFVNICRA